MNHKVKSTKVNRSKLSQTDLTELANYLYSRYEAQKTLKKLKHMQIIMNGTKYDNSNSNYSNYK